MERRGKGFARGKGRSDGAGRIGRLEEHTLGYYRKVNEAIQGEFESDEDRGLFLNNVFKQMCTEQMEISRNQTVSRIIEHILPLASPRQFNKFLSGFAKDWHLVCKDRFASHVTQTLITLVPKYINHSVEDDSDSEASDEEEEEELKSTTDVFLGLCGEIEQNLEEFMKDTYASHIVRVVLEILAGVKVNEEVVRSRISRQQTKGQKKEESIPTNVSPKFASKLESLANKIVGMPNLTEHVTHSVSNPVIQVLLLVLHKKHPQLSSTVCQFLIDRTNMFRVTKDDENSVPVLVADSMASHLVEQLLMVASEELHEQLFESHFQQRLLPVALHPVANFVLQRLITTAHTKKQVAALYHGLMPYLEDLLAANHLGVIIKLAEMCLKMGTKQEKLLKKLLKAFHCYKPEERQGKCAVLFASLTTYDVFYGINDDKKEGESDKEEKVPDKPAPVLTKVNLHGSILMQQLLQFGNPKLVVDSLLDLSPAELRNMTCDPCGSHIIDAFCKSQTIGEKSRDKLYNKLKGFYVSIACNKNGSRTMDSLWGVALMKNKFLMVEELAKHEAQLRGDRFGFFIHRNFAVFNFIHRRKEWKDIQTSNMKKRRLFEDIIGDAKKEPKNKKQKVKEEEVSNDLLLKDSDDETETVELGGMFTLKKKKKVSPQKQGKPKKGKKPKH